MKTADLLWARAWFNVGLIALSIGLGAYFEVYSMCQLLIGVFILANSVAFVGEIKRLGNSG